MSNRWIAERRLDTSRGSRFMEEEKPCGPKQAELEAGSAESCMTPADQLASLTSGADLDDEPQPSTGATPAIRR